MYHDASAIFEIRAHVTEHLVRVVLGMRCGHDDFVRREERRALGVQILVREEVHLELLLLKPVDEVRVGHELPRVVRGDLRPHVGQRTQP
jgi:hypothetical protein